VGEFVPQNYPAIAVTTNGVHLYKEGKGMLLFAVRRATWMRSSSARNRCDGR
jgi:hypothetical protein